MLNENIKNRVITKRLVNEYLRTIRALFGSHVGNSDIFWGRVSSERDFIAPCKRAEDAGRDIYASFEENYKVIMPNETLLIGTNIVSAFSPMYVAVLKERSSTGSLGVGQRSGVIDSGYRGEWLVPLTNHSNKPLYIVKKSYLGKIPKSSDILVLPYEKAIAQVLFIKLSVLEDNVVDFSDILSIESKRGAGKMGSSGK